MKIYKLIKPYIKGNVGKLLLFLMFSLILSLLGVISPYITGNFVDNLINSPTKEIIYFFVLLYFFIGASQLILTYIVSILGIKLRMKISFKFNQDILIHLHKISLSHLEMQNLSYLTQRIINDTSALTNFFISSINGWLINGFTLIFCFVVVTQINFLFGCTTLILSFFYIILYKKIKNPLEKIIHVNKENYAKYISDVQEQLSKSGLIRVFNRFNFFFNKLNEQSSKLLKSSISTQRINYIFTSSDVIMTMISQIVLFLIGGMQIINGDLSIGMFTVLITYFNTLTSSTKFFTSFGNNYMDNIVSANRISDILDIKTQKNGTVELKHVSVIKLRDLTFGYDINPIIENLNFTLREGNIYKIVGINGSGKSTLIKLLLGFLDDYEGQIMFDDIDINEIEVNSFRENCISYISQKNLIFNGTVSENVFFGNTDYNEKNKVHQLFRLLKFKDSDDTMDYLENFLCENQSNYSGGEIKKVELVRALIKENASIFILDEPTNSLDYPSKLILKKFLENNKKSRIVLLITHEEVFDDIVDYEISI